MTIEELANLVARESNHIFDYPQQAALVHILRDILAPSAPADPYPSTERQPCYFIERNDRLPYEWLMWAAGTTQIEWTINPLLACRYERWRSRPRVKRGG